MISHSLVFWLRVQWSWRQLGEWICDCSGVYDTYLKEEGAGVQEAIEDVTRVLRYWHLFKDMQNYIQNLSVLNPAKCM